MQDCITSMPEPIVLVISRDDSLVEEIKGIKGRTRVVQFAVCDSPARAGELLENAPVTLILADGAPPAEEAALARLLHQAAVHAAPFVMLLSASGPAQDVSHWLQAGARDCLRRPLDHSKLACLMDLLVNGACPAAGPVVPPPRAFRSEGFQQVLLGPDTIELLEQMRRVVPQETSILLTGEPGTGKTRLARLIHDLSPRRHEPFLVVDCSSGARMESELFGHVRGAFPGADHDLVGKLASAGRGTLVLKEVSALPLPLQGKLLHAMDERGFEPIGANASHPLSARLLASSSLSLEAEVAAGRFRAELYYRLNIVSFNLPSLRERRGTIAPLAQKFLEAFAARHRPELQGLAPEALHALETYPWPGNVRQLQRVVEQAAAQCAGPDLLLVDLPEMIRCPSPPLPVEPRASSRALVVPPAAAGTLAQSKANAELVRITQALRAHGNNRVRAAAELGISRMSLYKKLQKYGLLRLARAGSHP
jgi:DNA-binding NtrC family response regulator